MFRNLARLLGREEAELTKTLASLEAKSGFLSEDVRLLAENKQLLRTKVSQLGLDADDTTDAEMHHALLAKFERDARVIDKAVGVNSATSLGERLNKAAQLVVHCVSTDEVWVAKSSALKTVLTDHPPKHVSKLLGYRSVNSMIKRQELNEVYLAAAVAESATWHKTITKRLEKLTPSQRELQPIKIVNLALTEWRGIAGPAGHVISDKSIGAVGLWPAAELKNASVLSLALLLMEALEALNPDGYSEVLPELSPALRWWSNTAHLISDGEQPVSFNIKDVSDNHLAGNETHQAVRHRAASSLWSRLHARYQALSSELAANIPDIQYNFEVPGQPGMPTRAELAEEFVESERA